MFHDRTKGITKVESSVNKASAPLTKRDANMFNRAMNRSKSSELATSSTINARSQRRKILNLTLTGNKTSARNAPPKSQSSLSLRRLTGRRRKIVTYGAASLSPESTLRENSATGGTSESRKSAGRWKNDDSISSNSSRKRSDRRLSFLRRNSSQSSSNIFFLRRETSLSKDSKGGSSTEDSDFEEKPVTFGARERKPSIADRTTIVAELGISPSVASQSNVEEPAEVTSCNCATAILGHTYMEQICGIGGSSSFDHIHSTKGKALSEDPTVQESIECIFASQLEEGLGIWDENEDARQYLEERTLADNPPMVSPSFVQQSRLNRCDRLEASLSQSKKRFEQASLVYVGTFDPTIVNNEKVLESPEGRLTCSCMQSSLPALAPEDWPQAPLMLRPTPGKGTMVKGVRFANEKDLFWEPGSHLTWSEMLAQKWGQPCKETPRVGCCERCAILPINNGNETDDEALVIDFESDLFIGSLLVRMRDTHGTTPGPYDDQKGYFKGMNRRYQAVVRGRFKKNIPFTELRTGFQFDRPCGKLPPKWVLRGGIKVISFFAPQLDAKLEGERPHSLTPLGSTPQVLAVDYEEPLQAIQDVQEEPREKERTLLGAGSDVSSSVQRARARKKAFDKLFVQNSVDPRTDPSKIYTFEFLQHLFNFQDFSIELGSLLGQVELKDVLDGQPLQIMAMHGEHRLWSFDLWHEYLWENAKRNDERNGSAP